MKISLASTLALVMLCSCSSDDDDDTGATTNSTTNATNTTTVGDSGSESGGSSGGSSGATTAPAESSSGGSESSAMPGPPVINSITWTQADGCTPGTASDVDVVVDVTDPDTDVSMLTFSGMPIGCTGEINAPMVTISCPQLAPYMATVAVMDPEGGSDMLPITIMPCMDGMAP